MSDSQLFVRVADSGGDGHGWPHEVLQAIDYRQEIAYREVADVLGLTGPEEAFLRLSAPKRAGLSAEEFRDLLGYTFTQAEWERVRQESATYMAEPLAASAPRFEDLVWRDRWLCTRENILRAVRKSNGASIEITPYIATLPTWDFNALVSPCFSGKHHIIYFERGLARYLSDYALVVCWIVPPFPKDCLWNETELVRLVSSRSGYTMPPQSSEYMLRTLDYYLAGSISDHGSISLPPDSVHLYIHLVMGMYTFILLHEQAHLALRHVVERRKGYEIEFEADRFAIELMMEIYGRQGFSRAFAFWTADVVLRAFTFFEAALAALAFGPNPCRWVNGTHPAPHARGAALWKFAPRKGSQLAEAAESLRVVSGLLNQTHKNTLLTLLGAREGAGLARPGQGLMLSPLWREHLERTTDSNAPAVFGKPR
jgi:hypothetical protein